MDAHFEEMYAIGRQVSIPPEHSLLSWLLTALFSVHSCRLYSKQLRYNMLYIGFLDKDPDEKVLKASTSSKNMERLHEHPVSEVFFAEVVELANREGWISNEPFSVDGALIESWANLKGIGPRMKSPRRPKI